MILGVDASNIRGGGGVTHLAELLAYFKPRDVGFEKVIVWGSTDTLDRLPLKSWLEPVEVLQLDSSLASRIYWQRMCLPKLADQYCDILFVPGGSFSRCSVPVVTMSQNLLPFETKELFRYGLSWVLVRILLLRRVQSRSFRRADGVIYLTEYARKKIADVVGDIRGQNAVIPHGINERFYSVPRQQLSIEDYTATKPFRLLYVSIVDMYKHQWTVARVVARLRTEGWPVELDLVGPSYPRAYKKLRKVLKCVDPNSVCIRYRGPIPYQQLDRITKRADGVIFASTCENLPIILLEAMASGVPIACSNYGPMPEVLRDAGVYFDPESKNSLYDAIKRLLRDQGLRERIAKRAYDYAAEYSWERCARDTLEFLANRAKHFIKPG